MNIALNLNRNTDEILWKYTEKMDAFAKFTQYMPEQICKKEEPVAMAMVIEETPKASVSVIPPQKTSKRSAARLTPMDIIVTLTENNVINADYIKQSLKDFISKKEFQKVFGIKKTSEIMQALTDNKFNKSMALFISFMYDVVIIYMNKEVSYFTDDVTDRQKITV
jgi:hypothetical protein